MILRSRARESSAPPAFLHGVPDHQGRLFFQGAGGRGRGAGGRRSVRRVRRVRPRTTLKKTFVDLTCLKNEL